MPMRQTPYRRSHNDRAFNKVSEIVWFWAEYPLGLLANCSAAKFPSKEKKSTRCS